MPLPTITARRWRRIAASAKRLAVISVGFTLCGGGLMMLVLPGPTGGAAVAVILDTHRYLGLGVLVAGLGTLAILLPATRRLIDRAAPPTTGLDPVDPPPIHPSHTVKGTT